MRQVRKFMLGNNIASSPARERLVASRFFDAPFLAGSQFACIPGVPEARSRSGHYSRAMGPAAQASSARVPRTSPGWQSNPGSQSPFLEGCWEQPLWCERILEGAVRQTWSLRVVFLFARERLIAARYARQGWAGAVTWGLNLGVGWGKQVS